MSRGKKAVCLGALALCLGGLAWYRRTYRMPLKEYTRRALYMALLDDEICRNELEGKIIGGVLVAAFDLISPIIDTVMDVFGGLIDFITGIFSGNWEQAWNGIVDMFKGIFNLIPSIVEGILNGAIGIINGLIGGINKLTGAIGIPAIPTIPTVKLPRFHAGGVVDFEAGGEGLALLKSGEMVLTQAQQAQLFALANSGGLGDGSGRPVYLDISLTGGVEVDGFSLGKLVLRNLDDAAAFTLRG